MNHIKFTYIAILLSFYIKCTKNTFAKLKNIKNPNTSVAVVKNIEEDNAGSIFNFCKINGINIPDTPEIIKFATIAKKAIIPK